MSRLLYLARHGEQENAEVKSPHTGLSERGRRQATLLGERPGGLPIDAVHHGSLGGAAAGYRFRVGSGAGAAGDPACGRAICRT
ncbi:hypothetical protein GCM10027259_20870 [Micromonospora palomenae]|uniref:histidine phosphatase family protein n=1 Tax=Micromonospora palomenae TaxID=1461247 RepID=UPI0012B7E936|nr:histidine phosphatase family protein [Micromonospora palomenae]